MQEIWKDIKGYEGLYQVSNLGRVKCLSRRIGNKHKCNIRIQQENRIKKPCVKDNKYLYVSLTKDGQRNNKYIHRLVAEAFIPRSENKNIVNHKDYDVTNNRIDNLEWVTQKENVLYSVEHMRKPRAKIQSPTGFKYVQMRRNKYRLNITGKIDKCFNTLEEALKEREVVLNGKKYFAGEERMLFNAVNL